MIAGIVAGGRPVPPTALLLAPPALGTYWADEGGYYAGQITYADGRSFHLVVSDKAGEVRFLLWKTTNTATANTGDLDDGAANLAGMVAAGIASHPAGQHCDSYTSGGHSDWVMPSKNELNVLYLNLGPKRPGVPSLFSPSGAQRFSELDPFWSSTERTAASPYVRSMGTGEDGSLYASKNDSSNFVRPIRRVPYTA